MAYTGTVQGDARLNPCGPNVSGKFGLAPLGEIKAVAPRLALSASGDIAASRQSTLYSTFVIVLNVLHASLNMSVLDAIAWLS